MIPRPQISTRTATLFPYTPLFRSRRIVHLLFRVGYDPVLEATIDAFVVRRHRDGDALFLGVGQRQIALADARVERLDLRFELWDGGGHRAVRHRSQGGRGESGDVACRRSEEHTSELQSLMRTSYSVFCLKKQN